LTVHCFDEYYFVLAENTVKKLERRPHVFSAGDVIPSLGGTYEYPTDFDVLDLATKLVARIRNAKLQSIAPLTKHSYSALPLIDSYGSYIRLESGADFSKFFNELEALASRDNGSLVALANRWLDFGKFRKTRYLAAGSGTADYQI
jgi:bifunctional enzyme CysN/CysC/sulfate adenylyltransferase subunit 1